MSSSVPGAGNWTSIFQIRVGEEGADGRLNLGRKSVHSVRVADAKDLARDVSLALVLSLRPNMVGGLCPWGRMGYK